MNLLAVLRHVAGSALALGGAIVFIHGLIAFAAAKGNSPQSFGAVLFGYGCALLGVYVSPFLRQLAEDGLTSLRNITDRFFDF